MWPQAQRKSGDEEAQCGEQKPASGFQPDHVGRREKPDDSHRGLLGPARRMFCLISGGQGVAGSKPAIPIKFLQQTALSFSLDGEVGRRTDCRTEFVAASRHRLCKQLLQVEAVEAAHCVSVGDWSDTIAELLLTNYKKYYV